MQSPRSPRRLLAVPLLLWVLGCSTAAPPPPVSPITKVSTLARSTMAAADGVSLAYEVRGAGDIALVFIHCWACDRSFWREQLDAFSDHYQVVALDLPGHGASGRRPGGGILDLGSDVARLVEALGLEKVVLVGHSMGGPVSLAAARQLAIRNLGGRLAGIICLDSLHNAEMEPPPGMVEQMSAAFEADFEAAMEAFVRSAFGPAADIATMEWVVEKARGADPATAIELLQDFPSLNLEELFRGAGVAIRCINAAPGEASGTPTEVETNRRYADFDAELVEGVGHFLQLESPEQINPRIRQWVERLTAAPAPVTAR